MIKLKRKKCFIIFWNINCSLQINVKDKIYSSSMCMLISFVHITHASSEPWILSKLPKKILHTMSSVKKIYMCFAKNMTYRVTQLK